MADGGEGTVDAIVDALGRHIVVRRPDPLGRLTRASYGYVPHRRLAVMEIAAAAGLELVAPDQRDVLHANSFGIDNSSSPPRIARLRNSSSDSAGPPPTAAEPGCFTALGAQFTRRSSSPARRSRTPATAPYALDPRLKPRSDPSRYGMPPDRSIRLLHTHVNDAGF